MTRNQPFLFSTKLLLVITLALGLNTAEARHASLHPFVQGSYEQLLTDLKDKPFLMVLWSIDCPPCHKELNMLGKKLETWPQLNLILISTDDISNEEDIRATLIRHGLKDIESWAFADPNAARLRYEIDPRWFGTLPRGYFYDASHQRTATTGTLEAKEVEEWLKQIGEL